MPSRDSYCAWDRDEARERAMIATADALAAHGRAVEPIPIRIRDAARIAAEAFERAMRAEGFRPTRYNATGAQIAISDDELIERALIVYAVERKGGPGAARAREIAAEIRSRRAVE
jgi:hypothetical protein